MAFDDKLASRIRRHLVKRKGVVEKKMFGGVGFLVNGNMACGVMKDEMLVRVAPDETPAIVSRPHARHFEMGGRQSQKGWILVGPKGIASDADLVKWIDVGVAYASSLPKK